MIEIPLETQLAMGMITVLVFYLLINQIVKNISSINDNGENIIHLNKTSKQNREERNLE